MPYIFSLAVFICFNSSLYSTLGLQFRCFINKVSFILFFFSRDTGLHLYLSIMACWRLQSFSITPCEHVFEEDLYQNPKFTAINYLNYISLCLLDKHPQQCHENVPLCE